MTDADLRDALRDCYAPTLARNIVEARLIRSATLTRDDDAPGANVPGVPPRYFARITLSAPNADDTANRQLIAQIENRLLGLQAISRVTVTLLPAPFIIL